MMMGAPMFFGLLFSAVMFLGLPLLLVLLLREALLACTSPRRMPTQAECDACGYPVAGLHGTTCPECGGNLLVSGVRTAALEVRRRGSLLWGLFAWTAFMGLACGVLLNVTILLSVSGVRGTGSTQAKTNVTITSVSGSGQAIQADVSVTTNNDTGNVEMSSLTLTPEGGGLASLTATKIGGASTVHWIDASGALRQPNPAGRAALDKPTVSAWLNGLGAGPSAGYSDEEVAELVRILDELSQDPSAVNPGPLFTLSTARSAMRSVPSMASSSMLAWLPAVVLFAALGAWIAGLVYIPVRRRMIRTKYGVTAGRSRPRPAAAATAITPGSALAPSAPESARSG